MRDQSDEDDTVNAGFDLQMENDAQSAINGPKTDAEKDLRISNLSEGLD